MKKFFVCVAKLLLTAALLSLAGYVFCFFEYHTQFFQLDNVIGGMPLLCIVLFAATGFAIIWKTHRGCETSTTVFVMFFVISILLYIPSHNGNWFPFAQSLDTSAYEAPSAKVMPIEELDSKSKTVIAEKLPVLDGATALYPLYSSFANAVYSEDAIKASDGEYLLSNNTSGAYKSIIEGKSDIIFVAGPSAKQRSTAKKSGANLIFTPIGREAFVFMVGDKNPIDNLTYEQIKNIYSGKTAYWSTLGWKNGGEIISFQRPEGSGSQTGLQNLMGKLPIFKPKPLPDSDLIGRGRLTEQISVEYGGVQPAIGYSYRYYATKMYPNSASKLLSVNGIYPSTENIADGLYPFSSVFFAVTNGEPTGNTKKFIDWILSAEGQALVEKVGYVPLS